MNSQRLSLRALGTNPQQPTTAYDSLKARLIAYAVIFVTATCYAVISDLGFGAPAKTVATESTILTVALILVSPLAYRVLQRAQVWRIQRKAFIVVAGSLDSDAKPVLIYGAGDGGELLIREILNNPDHRYAPVGFIDDDERKAGKKIHGYLIFTSDDLPKLIQTYGISDVLISSVKVPEARLDSLRGMGVCLKKISIRIE